MIDLKKNQIGVKASVTLKHVLKALVSSITGALTAITVLVLIQLVFGI